MITVNGRLIAQDILTQLTPEVSGLSFRPIFCDVLVGADPVSKSYVNTKQRAAEKIGLEFKLIELPEESTTLEVVDQLKIIQQDPRLSGLIVQLPLPAGIDKSAVLNAIDPEVDVDGLSQINSEMFYEGHAGLIPPTAGAILSVLDSLKLKLDQLQILVIGQGELVGRPVTYLLKQRQYNVSVADTSTIDLKKLTLEADVIISATGQPKLINASMIKKGAVLIDAGTAESAGGIVGDVDTESMIDVAGIISPVPGGVGPVTVAKLLYNVVAVAKTKI